MVGETKLVTFTGFTGSAPTFETLWPQFYSLKIHITVLMSRQLTLCLLDEALYIDAMDCCTSVALYAAVPFMSAAESKTH